MDDGIDAGRPVIVQRARITSLHHSGHHRQTPSLTTTIINDLSVRRQPKGSENPSHLPNSNDDTDCRHADDSK